MPQARRRAPAQTAPVGPPISGGEGSRANLVFAIMLGILLVVGYLLWRAYEQTPPDDAPVVEAPAGAFKVRQPEAPRSIPAAELEATLSEVAEPPAPAVAAPVAKVEAAPPKTPAMAPPPAKASPAAAPAEVRTGETGKLVVQIAALRTEEAAAASWKRLAAQSPVLFQDMKMDLQRADLGAQGTYFRLRAGYFTERAAADRFCAGLKQKGQDCIVAAR